MTNKVIITGLPLSTSSVELLAFVRKVAPALGAEIIVDPVTSRSFGVGIVAFESVPDATRAVEGLANQVLEGKPLHMEYATAESLAVLHGG
jgi:RNA recognition motif-containing protein